MSTSVRSPNQDALSTTAGAVAVALGALALAATIFLYALSLLPSFNPSNAVRIVGLAGLPVGALGAVLGYAIARPGPGRRRGPPRPRAGDRRRGGDRRAGLAE